MARECAAGVGPALDGRAKLLVALDAVGELVERIGQAAGVAHRTGDLSAIKALDLSAAHAARQALIDALARAR